MAAILELTTTADTGTISHASTSENVHSIVCTYVPGLVPLSMTGLVYEQQVLYSVFVSNELLLSWEGVVEG